MVQVPKITLNAYVLPILFLFFPFQSCAESKDILFPFHRTEADILEMRRRYNNLYVPSDFFYSRIRWSESFPCHAPFSIKKPSAFHIFHKSVENPNGVDNGAVYEPPDADDTFSAKVN